MQTALHYYYTVGHHEDMISDLETVTGGQVITVCRTAGGSDCIKPDSEQFVG